MNVRHAFILAPHTPQRTHDTKTVSWLPGVPSMFDSLEVKVLYPIPLCGMKG